MDTEVKPVPVKTRPATTADTVLANKKKLRDCTATELAKLIPAYIRQIEAAKVAKAHLALVVTQLQTLGGE